MAIYLAGQRYDAAYIGGAEVGELLAGGDEYHDSAPPALTLRHTYTIVVGRNSAQIGYWDGNIGTISDHTYALPNGSNARIRQTMIRNPSSVGGGVVAGELRFLLNQSGLGTGDVAQFPRRIVVSRDATEAVCLPQSPEQIASFGQGIGRDYARDSGNTLDSVFANGETVTVKLYY